MFKNEGIHKTITGMNHDKYHVYGIENAWNIFMILKLKTECLCYECYFFSHLHRFLWRLYKQYIPSIINYLDLRNNADDNDDDDDGDDNDDYDDDDEFSYGTADHQNLLSI